MSETTSLEGWAPTGQKQVGCEPTAHRFVFSDSASLRFCRLGPTAHRFDWWQRQLLFATLGRSFAPVPPLPASVPVTTRETSQIGGRTPARCPTTGLRCYSPATLPTGNAGRNRHEPASKVSAPADIQGGDAVSDGKPFGRSDALSVRIGHGLMSSPTSTKTNGQNFFTSLDRSPLEEVIVSTGSMLGFSEGQDLVDLQHLVAVVVDDLHGDLARLRAGRTGGSWCCRELDQAASSISARKARLSLS